MRIVKHSLKGNIGEVSLVTESLDDLWHLKYIIENGDIVYSVTKRKADVSTDKIRPEKSEKKTVRLGVNVEKVEFHKFANRLRVHGVIESGMDIGSYHTLNIEQDTQLSIVKNWKSDQLERIKEAEKASKRPKVIIVCLEEGDADIGLVRHYGIETYSHITQSSGKGEGTLREVFFDEILGQILTLHTGSESVVIAGPGFTKEDFVNHLNKKEPSLSELILVEDTSSIGMSGFQEVLKRGAVDRIMEESRIARESKLMDELLKEISTNGKAEYGYEQVLQAHNYGSIETLLIADEMLRTKREKEDIDEFLISVENNQGRIVVFSTDFEPGQKLMSLGGIAALLRFKVQ